MIAVSTVIPTYRRPQYLPRAVESALTCQRDSVEVIVVPNGPDDSWHDSMAPWAHDPRVRVSPIPEANVSAARNHGMSLAEGKYLRFLDDDDYLLPAARMQIDILEQTSADVCSGLCRNIDAEGNDCGINTIPQTDDFVCGAASLSGLSLPFGNLWLGVAVRKYPWDPTIREREDYAWLLDLAAVREWSWRRCQDSVGVWFQHNGPRGSSTRRMTDRKEHVLSHLFNLHQTLAETDRLSTPRQHAIAKALWHYVHIGFPSHPIHWSKVGRQALAIDPSSRPADPFYQTGPFRSISPLLGEWLLLTVRRSTRIMHDAPALWAGRDYRRHV